MIIDNPLAIIVFVVLLYLALIFSLKPEFLERKKRSFEKLGRESCDDSDEEKITLNSEGRER